MKAILMAAGVGSRISHAVNNQPKSTLDIDGLPMIVHTVDMLLDAGVEVAVVTGYEHEYMEKILYDYDVKLFYNPFYRKTNSIASLWFARDFISDDDDVILANADVFWRRDVFDAIAKDGRPIVMLADETRAMQGDFFFRVEDDQIVKYGKELTVDERTAEYVGIGKIRADMINWFKDELNHMVMDEHYEDWWENILYSNIDNHAVFVKDISDLFWSEIDYIDDYFRIREYVKTGDMSYKVGLR